MSAVEERGRLPGGLSVWRGHVVLLRARQAYLWVPVVLLSMAAVRWVLAFGWRIVLILAALIAAGMVAKPDARRGLLVTTENQPGLAALVSAVAAATGTAPPDRIWLVGKPTIAGRATRRRRELLIGTPMLDGMTVAEVRSLIGHELSVLSHPRPWLVTRLLDQWNHAIERIHFTDEGKRPRRLHTRLSTVLGPFATEVHRLADAAARTAGGGADVGARAMGVAEALGSEYLLFVLGNRPPRQGFTRRALLDLDDGWRRTLAQGVTMTIWGPDAAVLAARQHPWLAAALTLFGDGPELVLGLAEPRVELEPLDLRDRKRLIRTALGIQQQEIVRWTTYEETSSWWAKRAAEDAEGLRRRVSRILGRRPVDDVETAEVLLTRNTELVASIFKIDEEELTDADDVDPEFPEVEPPAAFGHLVEDCLLRRGWRLEHPTVRGILISPAGERLDARTLVSGTYAHPDLSALRAVLEAPELPTPSTPSARPVLAPGRDGR